MDTVIVIGSNSAGYQLCGNGLDYQLPNCWVHVQIGTSLQSRNSMNNVDFVGYEPDVWCDPINALDADWSMLLHYDLVDADMVNQLADKVG